MNCQLKVSKAFCQKTGTIHVDGFDIGNIQLDSLRRHVGLVSQDITLFSGTIAENIGYRDRLSSLENYPMNIKQALAPRAQSLV
ncbi:unnamed protein product [Cuscuta campestris]|uniref:ABC transporter domain-containing protein n=1 Tax=Cuscuta campestris TaxID=132261 RepID=A0A484LEY3_9ASTE|nr:unnamed protein product [Cuscuta campestris]